VDGGGTGRVQKERSAELRLGRGEILPEDILAAEFKEGWESARARFGNEIHFHAPSIKHYETAGFKNSSRPNFIPVSITGSSCRLRCEHCRAKILETMHQAQNPAKLLELGRLIKEQGGEGMLISGGSLEDGTVPLLAYIESIARLKEMGLTVAVHTGLVDRQLAQGLADAGTDIAMLDIIGDDQTIHDVYHLDATTEDFERSLGLLCDCGVRTAPHVVIGLDFGRLKGERGALAMISRHPVSSLVLVILTSQHGTPMQEVAPPEHRDIGAIFADARRMLPAVPILLGCARPYGDHKFKTDLMALNAGLNGIAYPAEGIVERAREMGLEPVFSEQCCSLMCK
jgi:uncharacterized radical SAM superfamily protein